MPAFEEEASMASTEEVVSTEEVASTVKFPFALYGHRDFGCVTGSRHLPIPKLKTSRGGLGRRGQEPALSSQT